MRKVIVNSTPLIALSHVHQLSILREIVWGKYRFQKLFIKKYL